ncbi:MAG TPA: glycerol-3-phosphate responsive antiterminator [Thermoanaerobacter sp.]|nr:glycerol-3-phosphate responsive antiterminator [Thermoanaerobacter sp.]HHY78830.1 glycerol-3-phosphate responsive antiterminator [Thermoanaerobacter sp.]
MRKESFIERLKKYKLVAAVKDERHLEKALKKPLSGIFLLTGNIGVLKRFVDFYKENDFMVFVHVEKIGGISFDQEGLQFIAHYVKPDGVITTKANLIKIAKKLDLITIQRCFLIDSDAFKNAVEITKEVQPDFVELMPALIPSMIEKFKAETNLPIITGGLLQNKEQMIKALENGAIAVSTGNPELWSIKL